MRKATTIKPIMWKKRSFSRLSVDAKLTFLLLTTGPDTNLAGLVSYSVEEIALLTSLTVGRVKAAMAELVESNRVMWDEDAAMVLLLNWVKHNPLNNHKLVVGAVGCILAYENHPFHEIAISLVNGASLDRVSTEYREGIDTSQGQGQGSSLDSEKKKDQTKEQAKEVLSHLNKVTGRKLSLTKNIEACIKREGCTVEDCKLVIDHKWREWLGGKLQGCVNHVTPWRPDNFQGYLDEARESGPAKKRKAPPEVIRMFKEGNTG